MHIFCGEGVDLIVLVMNFMELIELRVNMQDPMSPIEDRILYEVHYHYLTDQLRQGGEISETVFNPRCSRQKQNERADYDFVENEVEESFISHCFPVGPFPRPIAPPIDFKLLVKRAEVHISRQEHEEAEELGQDGDGYYSNEVEKGLIRDVIRPESKSYFSPQDDSPEEKQVGEQVIAQSLPAELVFFNLNDP